MTKQKGWFQQCPTLNVFQLQQNCNFALIMAGPNTTKILNALSEAPLKDKWSSKKLGTKKNLKTLFEEFLEAEDVCLHYLFSLIFSLIYSYFLLNSLTKMGLMMNLVKMDNGRSVCSLIG